MSASNHRQAAHQALSDLAANGGRLDLQPDQPDGLARVLMSFEAGADQSRCRNILSGMKSDPSLWSATIDVLRSNIRSAA